MEQEMRAETSFVSCKQQHVIARKKCSLLNKGCSFAILLQNTRNEKKIIAQIFEKYSTSTMSSAQEIQTER